jgi:hypothetical protein
MATASGSFSSSARNELQGNWIDVEVTGIKPAENGLTSVTGRVKDISIAGNDPSSVNLFTDYGTPPGQFIPGRWIQIITAMPRDSIKKGETLTFERLRLTSPEFSALYCRDPRAPETFQGPRKRPLNPDTCWKAVVATARATLCPG